SPGLDGQPLEWVVADLDGAALERLIAEQQLAQRTAAQFIHIQPTTLQGTARRHAAGKDPRLAMTAQIHLADPALTLRGEVQRGAFVGAQRLPALEQWRDTETVIRQPGQAAGQRAFIEQP